MDNAPIITFQNGIKEVYLYSMSKNVRVRNCEGIIKKVKYSESEEHERLGRKGY